MNGLNNVLVTQHWRGQLPRNSRIFGLPVPNRDRSADEAESSCSGYWRGKNKSAQASEAITPKKCRESPKIGHIDNDGDQCRIMYQRVPSRPVNLLLTQVMLRCNNV
jgi:hypothetical protein